MWNQGIQGLVQVADVRDFLRDYCNAPPVVSLQSAH